jgi:Sec-independent protein secretion pathway component TatC
VPLYLLYELSIGLSWLVFRKRLKREREQALEDGSIPA